MDLRDICLNSVSLSKYGYPLAGSKWYNDFWMRDALYSVPDLMKRL